MSVNIIGYLPTYGDNGLLLTWNCHLGTSAGQCDSIY